MTGSELPGKASLGSWLSYGLGSEGSDLPAFVVLTPQWSSKAAAQALFLAGDSHDLIELARAEKDPAAKQSLVQQLSIMHNKEASDYMLEILNK